MGAVGICPRCKQSGLREGDYPEDAAHCALCGYSAPAPIEDALPPIPVHRQNTPYGTRRSNTGDLIEDQEEVKTLRLLFRMAEQGKMWTEIAAHFKERGILNRAGKPFHPSGIKGLYDKHAVKYGAKKVDIKQATSKGHSMDIQETQRASELRARMAIARDMLDTAPDVLDASNSERDWEGADALLALAQSQIDKARALTGAGQAKRGD